VPPVALPPPPPRPPPLEPAPPLDPPLPLGPGLSLPPHAGAISVVESRNRATCRFIGPHKSTSLRNESVTSSVSSHGASRLLAHALVRHANRSVESPRARNDDCVRSNSPRIDPVSHEITLRLTTNVLVAPERMAIATKWEKQNDDRNHAIEHAILPLICPTFPPESPPSGV
jgi:hypothetical protein